MEVGSKLIQIIDSFGFLKKIKFHVALGNN